MTFQIFRVGAMISTIILTENLGEMVIQLIYVGILIFICVAIYQTLLALWIDISSMLMLPAARQEKWVS